jgi:FAD synthase
MEVRFQARLRDERKFSGPDELRSQIARDISAAQKYFSLKRDPSTLLKL